MDALWEATSTDVKHISSRGEPFTFHGVRAIRNKDTGKVLVSVDDMIAAEFRELAATQGIEPRDVPIFWLFKAKVGPHQEGYIAHKYRLTKGLFYQLKAAENVGLGLAFPHDEFVPAKQGPLPKNLNNDLRRLVKLGLIEATWGNYMKGIPSEFRLTPKGTEVAAGLWGHTPDVFRFATMRAKAEMFSLTPQGIMEKVHAEFPEYRKTFVEPDVEE